MKGNDVKVKAKVQVDDIIVEDLMKPSSNKDEVDRSLFVHEQMSED